MVKQEEERLPIVFWMLIGFIVGMLYCLFILYASPCLHYDCGDDKSSFRAYKIECWNTSLGKRCEEIEIDVKGLYEYNNPINWLNENCECVEEYTLRSCSGGSCEIIDCFGKWKCDDIFVEVLE